MGGATQSSWLTQRRWGSTGSPDTLIRVNTVGLNNKQQRPQVQCSGVDGKAGITLLPHTRKVRQLQRSQVVFSRGCAIKSEADKAALRSKKTRTAGQVAISKSMQIRTGTNRQVLGPRPRGGVAADMGTE